MASKEDLLAEAELLDLAVTADNTKAEIQAAIKQAELGEQDGDDGNTNDEGSDGSQGTARREAQEKNVPEHVTPQPKPRPTNKPVAKAKRYKITTPVEGFNGLKRGVAFADGVGETENPWFAQRCRDAGYKVEEV